MKKTLKVKLIIDEANRLLSLPQSKDITTEFKAGICSFLESTLIKNKSYSGYMHLNREDCAFGTFGYFSRKYFE